ncbi:MAG: hypothetical protein OEV59_06885 [Deltaproteobacteria bacterium]|nr:hypothetical protein [Deltaproteobacteria bacterium]
MRGLLYIAVLAFIAACVMQEGVSFAGDKDGAKKTAATAPADGAKGASSKTAIGATITSDSMKMIKGGKEVVYIGNVLLDAGFQMCSEELKFIYLKAGEVSEINASGGVMFVQGTRAAKADSARYDKAGRILKLSGNAMASQCGTVIRGETITFDLDTDDVKVEAAGGKKVKMMVMPRKKSCQGKQSGDEIKCKSSR